MTTRHYSWLSAYNAVIAETDGSQLQSKIHGALAAFKKRRLSVISDDEQDALREAESVVRLLQTEPDQGKP